jgi:mannosyltransferase
LKSRSVPVVITLLLLITVLALVLRLYRLDSQSLWYDEAFSAYLAHMDPAEITARTAADIQPPLYYYLLHVWIGLLGDGEIVLRGLSALWGVLSVPLVYGLAWQLFHSRTAGLLAALLLAISPLHVWYGQEARMYTLLTFLCLLSSCFLLWIVRRSVHPLESLGEEGKAGGRGNLLLWLAFTLTNAAALYTHYFALFVLSFQAIYLVLVWWGKGFRPARLIMGCLASGLILLVAYLPWLPHLFTRYGTDVSYWPGQLKLPEVLLDIAVFFVGGESVSEPVGLLLAVGYGLVLILCLLAVLFRASHRREQAGGRVTPGMMRDTSHVLPASYYPVLFLLLYLLLPPALILALSYNSPKFNARYVMVSHPSLLLLLGGGLAVLWQRRSSYLGNLLRWPLAVLSFAFLLGVSAYADHSAYSDPLFARADFRGVARYVREQMGPDETVILCSGHMFPAFDFYAPDIDRYLLPDSPTLDTTRTLDYSIAAELNRWLADQGGVWLVLWQHEVVDPVGYLSTMLAKAGEELPVERGFSRIGLRHYRLSAAASFSDEPLIAHPSGLNFGNRLHLLGYTQTGEREVTLFWRAPQPLDEDYQVSVILRDTAGQSWGQWDGRPTAYLFPTDRWPVAQIVPGRYDLRLVPGAPPGDYGLEVGVYTEDDPIGLDILDLAGAPQGKRAVLGAVRLSVAAATADQLEIPHPVSIDLGGGLVVLGWDVDRSEAQPGDRLRLTLIWSVESQPQGDYRLGVLISDATGEALSAGTFPPTNVWHPTGIWQEGQAWRGQSTFRLPIRAQPGEARLQIQLQDNDGTALGPVASLASIRVLPTARTFSPPRPQVPRPANFDNAIALVGADLEPDLATPGGVLQVTLYWQAGVEMDVPYTVFVHLLGPDGRVVAGHDGEPVGGTRPTTGWVPGEFITDLHEVSIPADLLPGEYVVEVGLYDAGASGWPRLPILGAEGLAATDRVIFGPVQVR